jgi:hypothetical protein
MPKWTVLAVVAPKAIRIPIRSGLREGNRLPTAPAMTMLEGPTKGIRFNANEKSSTPKYPRVKRLSNNPVICRLESYANFKIFYNKR